MSELIGRHDANSAWWGAGVGIVRDPAFFRLPSDEQADTLAPWAWAEWRSSLDGPVHPREVARAGFWFADVQVGLTLDVAAVTAPDGPWSVAPLGVPADDVRPFMAERYLLLRGAGTDRLGGRYAAWARQLTQRHPEWALEVSFDGRPQGYFCATPEEGALDLTLAALYSGASVRGRDLYRTAIVAYGAMGAERAVSAFSVRNRAVHNLYVPLGGRYHAKEAIYLWEPRA